MSGRTTHRRTLLALVFAYMASPCLAGQARENRDDWQKPERVVADLNLKPGDKIADIGSGGGYFTFRLAKAVGREGKVYATEINEKALKAVADRATTQGLKNIETVLSEPTNTKLETASVDAALICNVLHHVPKDQQQPLFKDVVRAIRPGGFLYLLEWRMDADVRHDPKLRISQDDLVKMAKECGMTLDAEYHYISNQVFLRFRKSTDAE